MEVLEISSRTHQTEIVMYRCTEKGYPAYLGSRLYQEDVDPRCIELPNDIDYFVVYDQEIIVASDGRKYEGCNKILSVYMGNPMSIEDALVKYPNNDSLIYALSSNNKRVAVREGDVISIMYDNGITFEEYCDLHEKQRSQQTNKVKQKNANNG